MASARPSKFAEEVHPGTAALASYRARKLKDTEAIVAHAVGTAKRDLSARDISALATVTHTSKDRIRELVKKAKETFAESALDYVNIHKLATEAALVSGDLKVAVDASQWAIERASHDGVKVIEKEAGTGSGTKIMIGIRLGGQRETVNGAPIGVFEGETV